MADILQITLPDGTTYNIKDNNALPLTGGQVTGPVTFGSSVSIDDLTAGNIVVTGNTSFVQGIPWSTITGAPTTISGYGITDAVTDVAYDSSTYNITKTINGTTSNVYQMPCIAGTGTSSLIAGNFSSNIASGNYSFVAGTNAEASGAGAVALVSGLASQTGAVAIGSKVGSNATTTASGIGAIAIGFSALASNTYSIALGYKSNATGICSIAIGAESNASANYSLAFGGRGTKASSLYQTTMGKWNIEDDQDTYAFIVGNGTADNARSNALTVDWSGNVTANAFYGDGSTLSNLDFLPLTGGTMTGPINMGGGDFKIKYGSTPPASASLENNDIYFCTGEVAIDVEALAFDGAYDAVNNKAATVSSITSRIGNSKVFYGTSASTASTATKIVTCSEFTSTNLTPGVRIMVMFDETNTVLPHLLKLNVNSTGAYDIKYIYNGTYNSIPENSYIKVNQIYSFTFDGTYWIIDINYDTGANIHMYYVSTTGNYGDWSGQDFATYNFSDAPICEGPTYSSSTTVTTQTIYNQLTNGELVILARRDPDGNLIYCFPTYIGDDNSWMEFTASCYDYNDNQVTLIISMNVNNSYLANGLYKGSLPSVGAADNGKFLRVVNGVWVADTVPSASGVSF